MVAAGHIAVAAGFWTAEENARQLALLEKTGLPTQLPQGLDFDAILTALQADKKVQDGKVRFVMPKGIGAACVTSDISRDTVLAALKKTS